MEGDEILNPVTPTPDVVYSYSGGGGSRTTPEAHDDGVVLLVPRPGASSASRDRPATCPDLTSLTTRSNVSYTDWTTVHGGAQLPSDALVVTSQSVVGAYAYPDVAMAMEHSGLAPAPATSGPSTGPATGESYYTDMFIAHLSSDMHPATWNNNAAYPGSVTTSAAVNGVATATAGLNLNAVTARPDTNAVSFGYTIGVYQGMADLGSERRLHPAGTAAAVAAAEPGGGYYYNNSGRALPFAAPVVDESNVEGLAAEAAVSPDDHQVAGPVAEPVRGGLGQLGLAATSLATAGLIAAGVDNPVAAVVLFGVLIAGVILITVRV